MDDNARSGFEGIEGQGFVRKRLGRGLSALLGGGADEQAAAEFPAATPATHDANQISVELIERNPFQPRMDFEPEALQELVDSIKQHGVLQPLLVRPNGGEYQLIAGERRLLAAKQAGLETVPCRVLELEDRAMCEAALEENLKRRDLNVLEKAQAFHDYMQRFGASPEELAKQLSMSRSGLSNFLRLLELSDFAKQALLAERITFGHARAMLSLSHDDQAALCEQIEKESLTVRQVEATVRELLSCQRQSDNETIPFPATSTREKTTSSAHVQSLQEQLQQLFGVKVEIKLSAKEKGKIVIPFANNDEFEHVLRGLRRAA